MKDKLVKQTERLDDLGCKGYQIIQDPERFCFGMDAVLLSGFAKVKPGQRVLDLGTGTGIIPILLAGKTQASHITGLEIQPESADMASRSVCYNGLTERISIVTGDLKEAGSLFGAASFDVCVTNPPYMVGGHGLKNTNEAKTIARHEVLCNLEDVASAASKVLVPGGMLYMVHRPFRLTELMLALTKYQLEPKRIRFVYPYVDKEPNMVLIEAKKGANPRVTIEKPLIVYDAPSKYTKEILEIYKTEAYQQKEE